LTNSKAARRETNNKPEDSLVADIEVPVLVVGGGVVGMTASMLCAKQDIGCLLVTNHRSTSPHPRAHILNQRTMEIFDELGVAAAIYAVATPSDSMRYAAWFTGLTGPHARYGREIGRVEAWGAGWRDPDYIAASACRPANYPQIYLEPILKAHAEKLSPGRISFFHRLVDFVQDADGVTAMILNRESGKTFEVRAAYLIAADGGQTVGPKLGLHFSEKRDVMPMISVHFRADLSAWAKGPDVLTRFFINPDFGGSWASGALLPEGPKKWGNQSDEWVYHMKNLEDPQSPVASEAVLMRMRAVFGLPEFSPHIFHISKWNMEGLIADHFRVGRIFLMGDAVKRHPPTGGLGMNSGVQEAYNLSWKIRAVLNGSAGVELLDSYELERRPVAMNNVMRAIDNAQQHFLIDQALGLQACDDAEKNWARMEKLWGNSEEAEGLRSRVAEAISAQRIGFRHHNVEVGAAYKNGALIPDGSPDPEQLDDVLIYQPSTRPGHPLPHAMIESSGQPFPISRLTKEGSCFALIAGESGDAWIDAAHEVSDQFGVAIEAARIGLYTGDYRDTRGAWIKQRGIGKDGAILVRPDRYVAFRSEHLVSDPKLALRSVLSKILSRPLI
jgi:2,4-dichlorophenol 6-monooxygenase